MKLQDLAESPTPAIVATPAVPHSNPEMAPEPAAATSRPAGSPGYRWLVLESNLLGDEQFLVVFEKKHLEEARKAHPGKVIYFPPEVDELHRHKDAPEYAHLLKAIHRVKKKFGAWIVPSDSPLARRFDAPKGGNRRGTAQQPA